MGPGGRIPLVAHVSSKFFVGDFTLSKKKKTIANKFIIT
jgi:hypothetical protein